MAAKLWVGGVADHTTEWNQANNWSPAGVPADGDSVRFPKEADYPIETWAGTAGEIDTTQSGTVAFTGIYDDPGCTKDIGTEDSWLKVNVSSGSTHEIKLLGSGAVYLNAANSALVQVGGAHTLYFVGDTTSANALNIVNDSATVCVGKPDGTSVEFDTINIAGNAAVVCYGGLTQSDGASAPNINLDLGTLTTYCALGTVQQNSGTLYHQEGALASIVVADGTCEYNSVGTLTTAVVLGTLDCSKDFRSKTVTNCAVHKGAAIRDPLGVVTWTNGIDLHQCMPSEVILQVHRHATVSFTAI